MKGINFSAGLATFLFLIVMLSANAQALTNVTTCGVLSSNGDYALQNDVYTDGECFTTEENVTFDGQGHTVYCGYSCIHSQGIEQTNNTIIKNVNVVINGTSSAGANVGIVFNRANNMTFENITFTWNISKQTTGFHICDGTGSSLPCPDNVFKDLTIHANGSAIVVGEDQYHLMSGLVMENIYTNTTHTGIDIDWASEFSISNLNMEITHLDIYNSSGNINNVTISSIEEGIRVSTSSNISLNNVTISSIKDGIYVSTSSNISLSDISFEGQNQSSNKGINLYQANDFFVDNFTIYNYSRGISTFRCDILTFTNGLIYDINVSKADIGHGISIWQSNNTFIENLIINNTAGSGLSIGGGFPAPPPYASSENSQFINVTIRYSRMGGENGNGISIIGAKNVTVKDCIITDSMKHGTYISEEFGVAPIDDILFYNNYFANNNVSNAMVMNGTNIQWNTTYQLATNIIGGSHTGGNYYDDYTGCDNNNDGIGETSYIIASSNTDYLPLTLTSCPSTPPVTGMQALTNSVLYLIPLIIGISLMAFAVLYGVSIFRKGEFNLNELITAGVILLVGIIFIGVVITLI